MNKAALIKLIWECIKESVTKKSDQFAQCSTCALWVKDAELCEIHGDGVKVVGGASCGLYVKGTPITKDVAKIRKLVTPEQSGLVTRQVRCENCKSFNGTDTCNLYVALNKMLPKIFKLNVKVSPKGCCNAQTPNKETLIKRDSFLYEE
jgi:hypothetical protein